MSGKNIKPNLHNTEKKQIPALDKPNEEIQLDFIGPFTEKKTKGSLFYFQWTGLVNGRRQASVNRPMAKQRLSLWNNT